MIGFFILRDEIINWYLAPTKRGKEINFELLGYHTDKAPSYIHKLIVCRKNGKTYNKILSRIGNSLLNHRHGKEFTYRFVPVDIFTLIYWFFKNYRLITKKYG